MERASAPPLPISPSGPPPRAPPPPSTHGAVALAKRPRPPAEAEQVSAIPVAPHGPWPRPHQPQQPCWPTSWWATSCGGQRANTTQDGSLNHQACLMAEASPTLDPGSFTHCNLWGVRMGGPEPGVCDVGDSKGCIVHRCMCLWQEHASRYTGKCAEGCRGSTGLVTVVVLTLSYFITPLATTDHTARIA